MKTKDLIIGCLSVLMVACNSGVANSNRPVAVSQAFEAVSKTVQSSGSANFNQYNFQVDSTIGISQMTLKVYPTNDCSESPSAVAIYPAANPIWTPTIGEVYKFSNKTAFDFYTANTNAVSNMQSAEFRSTTDVPFQFVKCFNGKLTNDSGGACTATSCGFITTNIAGLSNNVKLGTITTDTSNINFTFGQLNYKKFTFSLQSSQDIVNLQIPVVSSEPAAAPINSDTCNITGNTSCDNYVTGYAQKSATLSVNVPRYAYALNIPVNIVTPSFGYTWMGGSSTLSSTWNGTLPPKNNPYPGARIGAASWIYNGNIYYFGGRNSSAGTNFYADFWIYNIATNTWIMPDNNSSMNLDLWSSATSGVTRNISGVTFGNSTFVAVGASNGSSPTILTSPDGATWTTRTSNPTANLNGVTFANNTFVAVGASGIIRTSSDGITWINRTSGVTTNLAGVSYANNNFVAVGAAGTILTSPDGIIWTPRSSGVTRNLSGVTFGNSAFVAVGASNGSNPTILTSPDGVTWTTRTSNPAANLNGVTFANNTFVAVGASGIIRTSSDGITWINRTSGVTTNLAGVSYANNNFVAVGATGTILTSPDGIIWTPRTSGVTTNLTGVAGSDSYLVTVGASGKIFSAQYLFINSLSPTTTVNSSSMGSIGSAVPFTYSDSSGNVYGCFFGGQSIYDASVNPAATKFRANVWCRQISPTLGTTWILKQGPAIDNSSPSPSASVPPSPNQNSNLSTNWPSARGIPASWDTGDYLWIYGGQQTNTASLNDLWRYDKANNSWTFMSGNSTSGITDPVRGAIGVESPTNNPGCRYSANAFVGKDGYLWLYGGIRALGDASPIVYSDVWRYNTKTNMWAWMSGSATATAGAPLVPNYGTKLTQASNNTPGARFSSITYTDAAGNFWLYGGRATQTTYYADLWLYNTSVNQWTFVTGPTTGTAPNLVAQTNFAGVFPVPGVEDPNALMPSLALSSLRIDSSGDLYFFGGGGSDTATSFNTQWRFRRGN